MFQVFEGIKQKEETKQTEFAAKGQEYKAMQAQAETVRDLLLTSNFTIPCFVCLYECLVLQLSPPFDRSKVENSRSFSF